MKKMLSLLAAALVLGACAEKVDPAEKFRDALPKAQALQLGTPAADGQPSALSVRRDALGETPSYMSEYAMMSYWTALSVNVGVWYTLTLVQFITAFPPTHCEEDVSCTWGPWGDDDGLNEWKLDVQKVGSDYVYSLSARPIEGTAPWSDILGGTATPGVDRDHGNGFFSIDFDAEAALAHPQGWVQQDYGQLTVDYDNTSDVTVGAVFDGAQNDDPANPHFMNATYLFTDTGAGGELQIAVVNLGTSERVSLRTRWDATGAGRGDAHYNAPGPVDFFATECWAGQAYGWVEVFDDKQEPDFGSEASCAFSPASFLPLPALP